MPQIEIMPRSPQEASSLYTMNHAYFTDYAWQMNRKVSGKEISTQFNLVRLPRQMIVDAPNSAEDRIRQNIAADAALIASHENEPVAYAVLKKNEQSDMVRLVDFVVRQKMRRQGIGNALLLAAHDWSLHAGCQRVVAEVQSKNDPAIQMLTRMGYDYCGFHEFFYANHDIVLFFSTYLR